MLVTGSIHHPHPSFSDDLLELVRPNPGSQPNASLPQEGNDSNDDDH
jgi:hypothetical protein